MARERTTAPHRKAGWPTSFDVAFAAGVSQPTVSRALRGDPSVSAETRERVEAAARQLNYTIDRRAARLRTGSTGTIAVVILTLPGQSRARVNPVYFAVLGAIGAAASDRGFNLLLSFQDSAANIRADYQQGHEADGLIVIGSASHADGWARFAEAAAQGANIVGWGAPEIGMPFVRCDNQAGGRLAAEHLIGRGRQRIAIIAPGYAGHIAFSQRREGYRAAMLAAGLEPLDAPDAGGDGREAQGEAAIHALLAAGTPFDAVFAASDLLALGAMKALRDAGRDIPEDCAVVGFDGIASAAHASPPLTTVEQDSEVAGQLLVDALLHGAGGRTHDSRPIPMRLSVRESCRTGQARATPAGLAVPATPPSI